MGGMAGGGGMGGMAGGGGMGGMPAPASSCLELRNAGQDIDGTYPIEVNGSPLTVYCDMTTDGGGWTQVYDQDVANGYDTIAAWVAGVNTDQPNMGHYSILNLTADFEGAASGFEFLIDWPDDGTDFVQWDQSADPLVARGTVSLIAQSPTNQLGCTAFGGLGPDGDGSATLNAYSALDGSTNDCWWWAIGTTATFYGGIPGYSTADGRGRMVATRTRLWVR
jgi:hypothetical protein